VGIAGSSPGQYGEEIELPQRYHEILYFADLIPKPIPDMANIHSTVFCLHTDVILCASKQNAEGKIRLSVEKFLQGISGTSKIFKIELRKILFENREDLKKQLIYKNQIKILKRYSPELQRQSEENLELKKTQLSLIP
jgi:hypothetical protein